MLFEHEQLFGRLDGLGKKRYAIVGMGGRGTGMFAVPLEKSYSDVAELVAISDINAKRLAVAQETIGRDVPAYTDFDRMLDEVDCDTVIVTTKDSTHHEFIVKALERGKDAITEKPMTVDDEKCRQILDAEARTGRSVRVTFNYRYTPFATRIKELLVSGVIGDVLSVDFQWYLDTMHGADYFRRWHRQKANSGGLFVHKATHHFDLVNWWLDQEPELVFALGRRGVYGPTRQERGTRCLDCAYTESCEYYMNIAGNERMRRMYLEAESEDGYQRDGCIFSDEVDIEDTMAAMVRYDKGVQMTYTLHAYMPFEGWRIAFNGTKGRLEAGKFETFVPENAPNFSQRSRSKVAHVDPWWAAHGDLEPKSDQIRIYPMFGGVEVIDVPQATGGHGGGDVRLRDMLFRPGTPDPLGHAAGSRAGAMSILVGVAANQSMQTGLPVAIEDLLTGTAQSVSSSA